MILITVKTKLKPGCAEEYLAVNRPFLEATRREPGNRWYEHFRSVDDPARSSPRRRSMTRQRVQPT